jgi:hypothetical protein
MPRRRIDGKEDNLWAAKERKKIFLRGRNGEMRVVNGANKLKKS